MTPVSNVWPMGFGWSSFIAPATIVASCKRIELQEGSFLVGERVLPDDRVIAVVVATDDVNLFERWSQHELSVFVSHAS